MSQDQDSMTGAAEAVEHAGTTATAQADAAVNDAMDFGKSAQAALAKQADAARTQMQAWSKTGVEQGQTVLNAMQKNAADLKSAVEASFTTANRGLTSLNVKAVEAFRSNANATFDLWTSLVGARTLSEAITLNSDHVRKQMDAMTGQARDLSGLAQRVATEALEPVRSSIQKVAQLPG